MDTYTFETSKLTLPEIKSKLASLEGFSVVSESDHSFKAKLGNSLKYRLLGSLIWRNYLAPMKVSVTQEDGHSRVNLAQPGGYIFHLKGKNEQFYQDSFSKVEQQLNG
ncbi:hypothetical protein [Corynebacterium sp.]|uniref:hypothetical protein n=1 Tax=Corynebacterium sp. TaxID=1720 RepID=UPI0026DAC46D|nr:hypothetical protein [Corynebacterium sp.]MDO4915046.1 hypothetical protein [Corynebacterium sp.]